MLLEYMVPFLLGLETNISLDTLTNISQDVNIEYVFNLNKTTVVYKDPLQTTYFNTTVICQIFVRWPALHCLLQNVTYLTTLKYTNLNFTEEIWKEHFKFEQWFEINFENSGVKDVRLHVPVPEKETELKLIKSVIKDVANQFDISGDVVSSLSNTSFSNITCNNFSKLEDTPVGTCTINYNMNMTFNNKMEEPYDYQIILSALKHFYDVDNNVHVHIEKKRQNCKYLATFADFLNGMEISNHTYTIEMINDKLNISTIMDVQLPPDTWNPSGSPMFTETTLLNLISISSEQKFNAPNTSYSIII